MITTSDTVMRTYGSLDKSNELHYAGLAMCEVFEKAGHKIIKGPDFTMPTIKKKKVSKKKVPLMIGMNPLEKFTAVMERFENITRQEMVMNTNLSNCAVSRCATIMEGKGLITREQKSGLGGEVVYSITGNK